MIIEPGTVVALHEAEPGSIYKVNAKFGVNYIVLCILIGHSEISQKVLVGIDTNAPFSTPYILPNSIFVGANKQPEKPYINYLTYLGKLDVIIGD